MAVVYIPHQMQDLTGGLESVVLSGASLDELLAALESRFPGTRGRLCLDDQIRPGWNVAVDDEVAGRGLSTRIQPESEVHFLPAIGGG